MLTTTTHHPHIGNPESTIVASSPTSQIDTINEKAFNDESFYDPYLDVMTFKKHSANDGKSIEENKEELVKVFKGLLDTVYAAVNI